MTPLASTLQEVRQRIQRAAKKPLNENNTKATLIEPVLRALGWDVEDIEEVVREFKIKSRDKPVDYGLLVLRGPRLFVEAKPLGENLDDRRWASQIMGYASVAGVEWIVLTDGNEYRIYNALAPIAVDEKLFRRVRVADDNIATTVQTLELLAKNRLEENRIEVLWRAFFVDRQVRVAIEEMFTPDQDMLLVNYVQKRTKNLNVEEIRASIARCHVALDFPVDMSVLTATTRPGSQSRVRERKRPITKGPKGTKAAPVQNPTTVAHLIAAGLIKPPLKLVRTYKGVELAATILKDGRVRFGGKDYDSLSAAASEARATLVGRRADGALPATNGWDFWWLEAADGKRESVGLLRGKLSREGRSAQ